MDKKEFAKMLHGRQIEHLISEEEIAIAKEGGLVVVFGESDDLMEFRGMIYDEAGCYDGGSVSISQQGLLEFPDCDEPESCKYFNMAEKELSVIEAIWCEGGYSWTYKTEIPHETFDILEFGDKYCKGIVFHINDIAE